MVGLRGVGKTVLLDQMRKDAESEGIHAVRIEAQRIVRFLLFLRLNFALPCSVSAESKPQRITQSAVSGRWQASRAN
jgi:hypothetical protein